MKMTGAMETSFKLALKKPPPLRTAEVNKTSAPPGFPLAGAASLHVRCRQAECTSVYKDTL